MNYLLKKIHIDGSTRPSVIKYGGLVVSILHL